MGIPDPHRDPQFYQGVPLRRFVAFLIDTAVITVLCLLGAIILVLFTFGLGAVLLPLAFVGTAFVCRWLPLSRNSATLGMVLTGVEVRDARGDYLTPQLAALHTAAFMGTLMFLPLAIIGWIMMAGSPTRRALHDTFLETVVINKPG